MEVLGKETTPGCAGAEPGRRPQLQQRSERKWQRVLRCPLTQVIAAERRRRVWIEADRIESRDQVGGDRIGVGPDVGIDELIAAKQNAEQCGERRPNHALSDLLINGVKRRRAVGVIRSPNGQGSSFVTPLSGAVEVCGT